MLQYTFTRLLAAKISFKRRVILLDRGFDQSCPCGLGLFDHVGRDIDDVELCAESFVAPFDRAKADEIDDANKIALDADRQLQHERLGA